MSHRADVNLHVHIPPRDKVLMWMLVLLWTLLSAAVHAQSWRPCTDLLPLDLLSRVLPRPGEAPPSQVRMVQSAGSRGVRLTGAMATRLSFPASQIFTNCDFFPGEFSLVTTVKIPRLIQKRNEYIFTLVEDKPSRLLLGLRVSQASLHFLVTVPTPRGRRKISFRDVHLADDHWHTIILAVTGRYATLTIDCGIPLEVVMDQAFSRTLSTRDSSFYIGSRRRWKGLYSGLLRQLVLLPGSDAVPRLCPSSEPQLAALSLPQVVISLPLQPAGTRPQLPYETAVTVTLGGEPHCSRSEEGQLWFNTQRKSLLLCDGHIWTPLLAEKKRLDYVEDYQDLYTSSETFDVEVFSIPSVGLFMAAANRDSWPGSGIYKWMDGRFHLYQNISTQEARAWKHFILDGQVFLVVANSRETDREFSVIYRWSSRRERFLQYQTIQTHSALDWEAFSIHNDSFLVVANHRRAEDSNHNIHSVIYRWNAATKLFEVNQTLLTSGAYDWEFFSVGPYHFLVVANTFDGVTTTISSTVYIWMDGCFHTFQHIPTVGATDWEMFQIEERYFLVVANSQRVVERSPSLYSLNSTIYELNTLTQTFIRFQDLLTHSAVDWDFFSVGEEKFLIVANSHDGSSYTLNSVIYRWQGYEGFVPVHSLPTFGCRDWEHFSTAEGSFLIYSSATSRLSKVFKLKTY
ncbi:thrombospondin-type laminin G domain and EAR repeat-containing protein-like [Lampris incognitus]|uniref:thrombospondin-type laminin G domain and EAR repeat-containing protein-like n=1 Tax=Lampris incognitus TaxID=2546036 RepID=UPI0024B52EE5|nr:thrombospondin-type laminin G domain and EAR repeat-containing protein-like [Lampris incognitus]